MACSSTKRRPKRVPPVPERDHFPVGVPAVPDAIGVAAPSTIDAMRMTSGLRFGFRLVAMALHIACGLVMVATLFRVCDAARRDRVIRWWSRCLLRILGVRLRVIGAPAGATERAAIIDDALRVGGRGAMLIMNHVSWLDIFVVHAIRPARFVAKAEIARWPLLGFLVAGSGTLFIERGKRHAVREINHRIAATLEADGLVGLFPEGTTNDGARLLPFHANLVQPAIQVGAPIVVAGIRYRDARGGPTHATLYVGDTTIAQSLLRIARSDPFAAELHLLDVLDGASTTRHAAGLTARTLIAAALGLDDAVHEASKDLSTMIVVPDDATFNAALAPGDTRRETLLDPRDELL